jgi:peptide/nickel transport system substrate-binding protein
MTEDPAGDLLAQVRAKYPDRFRTDANPPNIYWLFLNHSIKPFSSLEVRRAVNYAIDSRALQRVFGGLLQPTCNFLPPAYAGIGYRRIDPCPYGDPAGPGDVAKARRLVEASGHKGEQVTVNQLSTTFVSTRMNAKSCSGVHLVYKHDWSLFCLK